MCILFGIVAVVAFLELRKIAYSSLDRCKIVANRTTCTSSKTYMHYGTDLMQHRICMRVQVILLASASGTPDECK